MSNPETNRGKHHEDKRESFRRGLEEIIKPQDLDVLNEKCPTDLENPLDQNTSNLQ